MQKEPAMKFRIGVMSATIWAQSTKNGTMYNTSIERAYQNPQTGKWETAHTFGLENLAVASQLCTLCTSWIVRMMNENHTAEHQRNGSNANGQHSGNGNHSQRGNAPANDSQDRRGGTGNTARGGNYSSGNAGMRGGSHDSAPADDDTHAPADW